MVCNVWTCLNRSFVTLALWQEPQWSQPNRLPSLLSIPFWFVPPVGQVHPSAARWLFRRARGVLVCRGTLWTVWLPIFREVCSAWSQWGSRLAQQIWWSEIGGCRVVFCHFLGGWTMLNLKVLSAVCFSILSGKVIQICSNQQGSLRFWCFQARTSLA